MTRLNTVAENIQLADQSSQDALPLPMTLTENQLTYISSVPSSPSESAGWTPFNYGANSNLGFLKVLETDDGAPMDNVIAFDRQILTQSLDQIDADLSREVFGAETSAQTRTVTGGNRQGTLFSLPVRLAPRPGYLQVFPEASVQSNNESPVVAAAAVSPLTPSASNFGMSDTSGNHVLNPQTPGDFENQYTFL